MIEIKTVIPDIHGFTPEGQEVGGKIAEMDMDRKIRHARFGCIYPSANACPLQAGIKAGNCDADNYTGKGRDAVRWQPPGLAVGCGRTDIMKRNKPGNLEEFFPNHIFLERQKKYRKARII